MIDTTGYNKNYAITKNNELTRCQAEGMRGLTWGTCDCSECMNNEIDTAIYEGRPFKNMLATSSFVTGVDIHLLKSKIGTTEMKFKREYEVSFNNDAR